MKLCQVLKLVLSYHLCDNWQVPTRVKMFHPAVILMTHLLYG